MFATFQVVGESADNLTDMTVNVSEVKLVHKERAFDKEFTVCELVLIDKTAFTVLGSISDITHALKAASTFAPDEEE
jgi:hypothetical protein